MNIRPTYAAAGASLYRFISTSTAHFSEAINRLLLQNEIYLTSRLTLNDPFDIRPQLYCDWTTEGVRRHMANIFNNPLLSAAPVNLPHYLQLPSSAAKKAASLKNIRLLKRNYKPYMEELLDNVGVCCFTEGLQNPLFWAHYSDSYKGICIELKASGDRSHPFCNCMKVHYAEKRPVILASQTGAMATVYNEPNWSYISQYGLCTKSTDWAIEKEWRFWIPHRANSYQQLPSNTVAAIFLGPSSNRDTCKLIVDLVKQGNSSAKVFTTSLSETDFKIEIAKRLH